MDVEKFALKFRAAVQERGEQGPRNRYPAVLRSEAVAFLQARVAQGVKEGQVAEELGVDARTLRGWAGQATEPKAMFRRVEMVAESKQASVVVYGPAGIRIEGLSVAELVEVMRGLR